MAGIFIIRCQNRMVSAAHYDTLAGATRVEGQV